MFEHTPVIYAALKKFAYAREYRDADFKQDVIAIVLERFSRTYDPTKSKPTTYLYKLTWSSVHQVRSLHKLKADRMPTMFLGDTDVAAPHSIPAADNADGLEKALQAIEPKRKQAITLIFYKSCTYTEAGAIMGVSRQRVKQFTEEGIQAMHVILTREKRKCEANANNI